MSFTLIYITTPNEQTAQDIAKQLVEKKLVACANIFPISSVYWWQEVVQSDKEVVLIVKTPNNLQAAVSKAIEQIHPYNTPCIMYWQVAANAKYEEWIEHSCKQ